MHELGIANSVLDAVREEVARRPGAVALKVGVRIGELAGVDPDALAFGFEVLTSGTEWKDLKLEIEKAGGDQLDLAYLELEEP
jgi:hydrogenase nickel incorporation protein HypA/HybF